MSGDAPPWGSPLPANRWDLLDGVQPARAPTVTVVLTHFEQPEALARTVAALRRQTHPAERLQVVVSDDGSAHPPQVPAGVTLVRQSDRGFRAAAARNLGAAAATGEVLVFLDADTTPEPSYVERLVRLPALVPDTVTVGRRVHADLAGAGDLPVEVAGPAGRLDPPAWLTDGLRDSRHLLDADDSSYRFVLSAVLCCSRWFFEEVGGFDETFTGYGGEDWEWADRAWRHGAVLAHVADAVAWHDGPDWAGREVEEAARVKNAETTRLLPHGLPGLRPRALHLAPAETEVVLASAPSAEAALVGVDVLLTALPAATVAVPESCAPLLTADPRVRTGPAPPRPFLPRVRMEVPRPVRLDPDALAASVGRLRREALGRISLVDRDGRLVADLVLCRAEERQRRWGHEDLFQTRVEAVDAVDVPAVPDLEGYLGGWA